MDCLLHSRYLLSILDAAEASFSEVRFDFVQLIYQPPSSPEVNPTEHVWEELREKYFPNRFCDSLDQVIEVLCQGLNDLRDDSAHVRSLTSFPHFQIEV